MNGNEMLEMLNGMTEEKRGQMVIPSWWTVDDFEHILSDYGMFDPNEIPMDERIRILDDVVDEGYANTDVDDYINSHLILETEEWFRNKKDNAKEA